MPVIPGQFKEDDAVKQGKNGYGRWAATPDFGLDTDVERFLICYYRM